MSEATRYEACVVSGVEGPSLYLNNYRIAGSKPWGGGTFIAEWKGWTVEDLFAAIPDLRALRESHAELKVALEDALHRIGNMWFKFGVPPEEWNRLKQEVADGVGTDMTKENSGGEYSWKLNWQAYKRGCDALEKAEAING